jgi:hypothetical protein
MAKELDVVGLDEAQVAQCHATISPNTFYMLVGNALVSKMNESVVRMGDGEKELYKYCQAHPDRQVDKQAPWGEDWQKMMGCHGIPCGELVNRIQEAAEQCTYFAPQVMGIQRPDWRITEFFHRDIYVDNWFVREWTREMQDRLYYAAKGVTVIHGSTDVLHQVADRVLKQGVAVNMVCMKTWHDGDSVIKQVEAIPDRLVLFAGGPANKYIAPRIAAQNKVVLDIGQALAKEWT